MGGRETHTRVMRTPQRYLDVTYVSRSASCMSQGVMVRTGAAVLCLAVRVPFALCALSGAEADRVRSLAIVKDRGGS